MKIIIISPRYQETSEGIKVLHFLCHSFNKFGYPSKILFLDTNDITFQKFITLNDQEGLHPDYLTKSIKSPAEVDLDKDVILYPEIISNNPLNAKNVVRYFLNKPGNVFGNSVEINRHDFLISYQKIFYPAADFCLFYPLINLESIPNREQIKVESKNLMLTYFGKGVKYGACTRIPGSISLDWKKSYEEYVILLKNSRYIFTWDGMSGVNSDAIEHGSIPVLMSSKPWGDDEILNTEIKIPIMTIEEFGKENDALRQFSQFLDQRDNFYFEVDKVQKEWPEKIHTLVKKIIQHFF